MPRVIGQMGATKDSDEMKELKAELVTKKLSEETTMKTKERKIADLSQIQDLIQKFNLV